MAKPKEVTQYTLEVPDRPGVLAKFAKSMKESKVNLKGVWAFGMGGGRAHIMAIPHNPAKFKRTCEQKGYALKKGSALFLSGLDKAGVLCTVLDKIADSHINLYAVDAVAVGNKFGAYLWADPASLSRIKGLF